MLTVALVTFTIWTAAAAAFAYSYREHHAAVGTIRFFKHHPRLLHGPTRPAAVAAIAKARRYLEQLERPPELWRRDAICETGYPDGGWHTRAGIYEGGIRFYYGTWDAWKSHVPGASVFAGADQAPAAVQAAVAQWGLEHVGTWGCLHNPWVWAAR